MMADLIDRAALLDDISAAVDNGGMGVVVAGTLKRYVKRSSAVDAVEVVRCKDCTQWGGVVFGNVCRRWSAPLAGMKNCTGPNDFCSYGERREDDGCM